MKINLKRLNDKLAFESSNEEGNKVNSDANPAIGGEGLGFRPMELLLTGLASCASIDILLILKKKRIELTNFEVEIQGIRKDAVPSPFEKIHLLFKIGENDLKEQVEKAVKLSLEKYCSVVASLSKEIEITYEIVN
ncbi:MAG: OsmC family protein [Bacteroidota bacterium]